MKRRDFVSLAAAAGLLPQGAQPQSRARLSVSTFDPAEATVDDLRQRMERGYLTSSALVAVYLMRIADLDKRQGLNSVIEINPDARRIAHDLDAERKSTGPRGPLHGIPVLIKDNIDTADRMRTTAGSLALADSFAPRDAFIAARLRAAGAVILGKTNLSEWANFRSTHSVSGWSGRGGQTHNPYALDRNPCGSSSGSGAAVSANLCALAIGTETDGSVVCPSSMNGIVGIKPTLGLLSRSGIIPIAHSQDTAGPMARTVRDAAILLTALTGVDANDSATANQKAETDYTQFLDSNGLKGARLGVARRYMGMNATVDKLIEDCLAQMKSMGAEIVDPADMPRKQELSAESSPEQEVLLYEFKADLNAYLANRDTAVKTLADVIAFNDAHRDQEMPWFGQELMIQAQAKGPLTDAAYRTALERSKADARAGGIDGSIEKFKLDAIVAPSAGPSWLIDWVNGDFDTGGCSSPAAVAGYPHITVPAGFAHWLPIGLSFYGAAWSEPKLLKYAYAFEQATKARRQPQLLKTLAFTAHT